MFVFYIILRNLSIDCNVFSYLILRTSFIIKFYKIKFKINLAFISRKSTICIFAKWILLYLFIKLIFKIFIISFSFSNHLFYIIFYKELHFYTLWFFHLFLQYQRLSVRVVFWYPRTGPQLMAYLCQVDLWLEEYNPRIEVWKNSIVKN